MLEWLYVTIPFIQLWGNRFNIMGFAWFLWLTVLTVYQVKQLQVLYTFTRWKRNVVLVGVSVFTVWVFYRMLDELLTIFTVVRSDVSLLTFQWESVVFWMGKGLSYSILILGFIYLVKVFHIHRIFHIDAYVPLIAVLVVAVQQWSVTVFKWDYALLSGVDRITVFWMFYPLLYLSYALFYGILLRRGM